LQHVIDIAGKLSDLNIELDASEVQRLKAAADLKMGLIKKTLPDLKSVDIEGNIEHSGEMKITWQKPS
jgi:hypothetical protein